MENHEERAMICLSTLMAALLVALDDTAAGNGTRWQKLGDCQRLLAQWSRELQGLARENEWMTLHEMLAHSLEGI